MVKEETSEELKTVTFGRTPKMSSYLLAFIVGEYDYIEGFDEDGVRIRVYTPVGKKEQGKWVNMSYTNLQISVTDNWIGASYSYID